MTPWAKYFCTKGYSSITGRLETITDTYLIWLARRYCSTMVSPLPPIVLSEAITEDEIEAFAVCAFPHPYGDPICVYRGTTIGHKAICAFPTIKTGRLEIRLDREKAVTAEAHYIRRY